MGNITITGTGGAIEGNLGTANVDVSLDTVLEFDGTNDVITVSDHSSLDIVGDITISAWVKITLGESDFKTIVAKAADLNNNNSPWQLRLDDSDKVEFVTGNGSAAVRVSSTNAIKEGWNHIAVTVDENGSSSVVKYFINGVLDRTVSSGWTDYSGYSNSTDLRIGVLGNPSGSAGYYFDGYLADVRIYNAVVSDADVAILASQINGEPSLTTAGTTNLQGWWKLNNNSVTDSSPNSNDGTASGPTQRYDQFHIDVYDNSTTTDGTFTVTQGKVEGKALSSVDFESDQDYGKIAFASTITQSHDNMSIACWIKRENATGQDDTILGKSDLPHHHYLQIDTDGDIRYKQYPNTLDTGAVVTDINWHHIIVTLQGDNNGAIYLDGVAQTITTNTVTADGTFDQIGLRGDSGDGAATADEFDGKIRDVRFYDYALSAEQAASLYSGTYPQTPKHHYKLDEGSGGNGDTVADTGTATTNNGTLGPAGHAPNWSNGTLDLDHDLVIAANGTLSAPRGDLSLVRNFQNSGVYTHNNGTFAAVGGDNTFINTTGTVDPVFYNVRLYALQLRFYQDTTIERQLQLDSGATHCYIWANKTLTMGTATNPETGYPKLQNNLNTGDKQFWFYAGDGETATLQGVSELYPIIFTNTNGSDIEWGYHDNAAAQIKNIDFQFDITTDTSDTTDSIKLTGDCEFDTVTINAGDTLDLNGQRAEFSGNLSNQSTGSGNGIDYDGMIYFTGSGRMDSDGASTNLDLLTLVQQGTSTSDADLASDGTIKTMFYNQPSVTQKNHRGAIQTIIGCGTATCGTSNSPDYTNLTVATGGTLDGSSSTLTVAGDFTTSGGMLGTSCLSLDRDNTEYAQIPYHADLNLFSSRNAMTAECWFKTSYTGSNHQHIMNLKDADGSPQVMQMYIDYSTGKLNARILTSGTTSSQIGASDVRDGKWHHVAIVYDGDYSAHATIPAHKLYIDGKLEAEELSSGAVYAATDAEFNIGVRYSLDQGYFEGEIDEVRLFAAAKTATQIRADMFKDVGTSLTHFNSAADGSTDGLVGRWGANEGTGSALSCSNSNLNGVIYDYNGGSPAAYTDAWAGAGTFTAGTSTLKMTGAGKSLNYLSGEELSHLLIDNSSGTVTASVLTGTNNLTVLSLTVNDSSASFTAPAGTLTITGKNASNYIIDLDGVFVHSSGTVKIDTSLTGDKLLDIIPSSGTGLNNLITNEDGSGVIQYNGNSTIAGNLTVEEGTLHGYDYNNSELTVTGDVTVESGGTLGVSNQTGACSFASLTINSGGTHVATSGTTTITNIESGASRSILNNGTFTHNSGTVLFNGAMDQKVSMDGTGNLHNVTLNKSNNDFVFIDSSTTVEGNLDITMADNTRQCRPSATSGAITVTGDVIVREGILLRAANDCTGAMSFGGLKLESGSIYAATNATTTITNRITGESHLWKNDGGTFTHNNGTVKFNDNDHSAVKENTFYNVEVESNLGDYAVSFEAQGGGGNPFTILNDLTITRGDFELVNANDTCDIHGKTIINGSSNSAARFNNDKNQTATITHHGPVEIHTGTYHVEDGGSVKILSGFRNIGGVVD